MKRLIIISAILLSGCASWLPKAPPEIVYVPQEVKIEVPVKCTPAPVEKPNLTFNGATKDDLLYNNLAKLGSENESLSAYTTGLEAALAGCTK
jgi:hypothetical protein